MAQITTAQAAKRLGVSQKTVRRWVHEGRLPVVRTLGNHIRIDRDTLDKLTGRFVSPISDPESEF